MVRFGRNIVDMESNQYRKQLEYLPGSFSSSPIRNPKNPTSGNQMVSKRGPSYYPQFSSSMAARSRRQNNSYSPLKGPAGPVPYGGGAVHTHALAFIVWGLAPHTLPKSRPSASMGPQGSKFDPAGTWLRPMQIAANNIIGI